MWGRRYCIMGDGCNMEGISNEAASLAGHWGLGKLIAFYDDNQISIDGNTEISFTEDVSARYEALGWHTIHVKVLLCTSSFKHAGFYSPHEITGKEPYLRSCLHAGRSARPTKRLYHVRA